MSELNRRDFFKIAGAAGAAGLTACDVMTPVEELYPYVVKPDEITPGVPTYFSTLCGGCASACSAVARHREGRVVFLGSNPDAPGGRGLCAAGVASTQDTYDPDRVKTPTVGGSSSNWGSALDNLGKAIQAARDGGKTVAWLGRYRTGALANLISQFMNAVGGRELHWEPLGYESLVKATDLAFGIVAAPRYELEKAQVIVGFGADFLHTWLSPVSHSQGWAAARDPNKGGFVAEYYEIAPTVSHTGTRCDTWWATKPGTEAGVALALAKLVASKRGSAGVSWLGGVDAAALAAAAGVSLQKLETLADKLVRARSVIFPGGATTNGSNGTNLALATLVLNAVCGNIGETVHISNGTNLGAVSSYAEVEALFQEIKDGKVGVLLLDDLDPVFSLPAELDAFAALETLSSYTIFANHINESFTANAVVLPPGTALETWGDAEPVVAQHGLQQPAMKSIADTRSVGDVLLQLAKSLNLSIPSVVVPPREPGLEAPPSKDGEPAPAEPAVVIAPPSVGGKAAVASFEAEDFYRYIAGWWHGKVFPLSGESDFSTFWVNSLQKGGYWPALGSTATALLDRVPKVEAGAPVAGETALVVYPHALLHDGRHAHKAWLQEIADPVSGYAWNSWVEISPVTADKLGVTAKDSVLVQTDAATLELGVRVSKGVPEGVAAVVLGNGHSRGNRYSKGWGQNGFRLLKPSKDPVSGALALQGMAVSLSRSGKANPARSLKGSEDMDGRPVAMTSSVEQTLSGAVTEVGGLVPIHKVPEDPRLVAQGIHDMFPEPEHPTYRFGLAIDLDSCTGCGACEAACYAENNISIVGPEMHKKNRQMGWIRLDRFWEGEGETPDVRYLPAMCQQCSHAPCEGVCPVVATYHNLDGLNAMIYNRCVGTRYCANNCPYSARRFNFHTYRWPEAYELMLNPDVSTREVGVMEKCTFCIQRVRFTKASWRGKGAVPDSVWQKLPACAEACPSQAITFGNAKDPESAVSKLFNSPRAYTLFGELNTKPGVRYLSRLSFHAEAVAHGGGHAAEASEAAHGSEAKPSHGAGEHAGAGNH